MALPKLPLLSARREHGSASPRAAGRAQFFEDFPQKGATSARVPPVYLERAGGGPNGSPSAMYRPREASTTPRGKGKVGDVVVVAHRLVSKGKTPYRWVAEGKTPYPGCHRGAPVEAKGSAPPIVSSALPWPMPASAPPKPGPDSAPPEPGPDNSDVQLLRQPPRKRDSRCSLAWFKAGGDGAREIFGKPGRGGGGQQGALPKSRTRALLAAPGAADADAPGPKPGTDTARPAGRAAAEQFCRTLARELGACQDGNEVDKLLRLVRRVMSSTSSDTFSTSGAQAYRFREALRPLRESSVGAALGYSHRLWLNRAIERQVQRRRQEITSGEVDSTVRPPPLEETAGAAGGEGALASAVLRKAERRREAESRTDGEAPAVPKKGQRRRDASPRKEADRRRDGDAARQAAGAAGEEGDATSVAFRSSPQPSTHELDPFGGGSAQRFGRHRRSTNASSNVSSDSALCGEELNDAEHDDHNKFKIGALRGSEALRIWRKVFEALKVDGEVHHTDLRHALEMAGFQKPDQSCINAAKERVTKWSTLSAAQFNEFATFFGEEEEKKQHDMFASFDADCNGHIDRGELESLLKHFGIIPMRHILDEVLTEVDEDGSGSIGMEEFRKCFEILRLREGFSREEFQNLIDLFKRMDLDDSGEMNKQELTVLLGYLDYQLGADEQDTIMKEVDTDDSGELGQLEFLLFMKKCRKHEIGKLTAAFSSVDPEEDGMIGYGQMIQAFTKMGYEPDADAMWEAALAAGISKKEHLDSSDFWLVLTECRAREWFFSGELQQISEVFGQVETDGSGEIDIMQIDKALLALGLSLKSELLLYLIGRVDLDNSGRLNQTEFRKLIRMFQNGQLQLARVTFEEYVDQGNRWLSITSSWKAFVSLGLVTDDDEKFNMVRELGALDIRDFLKAVRHFDKEQQMYRQKNCGFGEQAVNDLALRFQQFDADNSGVLESRELVLLVEELLPGVATSSENRPKLMKMMKEAQGSMCTRTESDDLAESVTSSRLNSGKVALNFAQFLKLLSLVRVFKLGEIYLREQRVISECDLTTQEVQQFRELFLESASGDGCMTLKDLWLLFRNVCPLGDRNKKELQGHIQDVVGNATSKQDMEVNFAELMMLMGRLRDANFGGIRDKFFS